MKKILIGTHNTGKFKEISYLLSKNIKKISPVKLKIKNLQNFNFIFQFLKSNISVIHIDFFKL